MTTTQEDTDQQELFNAVEGDFGDIPLHAIEETDQGSASLKHSMDALGNVSTPVLRRDPEHERPYRIVEGRRRIEVLRQGDTEKVHAFVIEEGYDVESKALTAAMNIVREPNPMSEARAIGELLDAGYTEDALSRLGIPKQTIRKRVRLWNAPEKIKEGVSSGDISAGAAEKVANLSPNLQERCVEHYEEEGKLRHKDIKSIRQVGVKEEVSQMGDDLFETPDVDRETRAETVNDEVEGGEEGGEDERPVATRESSLDRDKATFGDYIKVAGVVNEYFNPEGEDDLSAEEVAQQAYNIGTRLGYPPEKVLEILSTPPAHFLPDDAVGRLEDKIEGAK